MIAAETSAAVASAIEPPPVGVEWSEYVRAHAGHHRARTLAGKRIKSWIKGRRPPAKADKIRRCADDLGVAPGDIVSLLWPGLSTPEEVEARSVSCRIHTHRDRNQDGTYNRVCAWCGRSFVSAYANGSPSCADCLEGNTKYRKRNAVESGRARAWRIKHTNSNRPAELSRNKRSARVAIRRLAIIRRQCDRIERVMNREILVIYRRAYAAHRRSIAALIEKDNNRRKTKRRRSMDPCANRGTERNWWVFDVYKEYGYTCAYCGMTRQAAKAEGFDVQADHIIPLGHPNFTTGPSNCAPACIHCNSSKGNRDLLQWAASKNRDPHPLAIEKYNALMSRTPMKAVSHG